MRKPKRELSPVARVSPDVTRYAIFAGPDSQENLTGWVFTDFDEVCRIRATFGRGPAVFVLPDAATASRLAAATSLGVYRADGTFDRAVEVSHG